MLSLDGFSVSACLMLPLVDAVVDILFEALFLPESSALVQCTCIWCCMLCIALYPGFAMFFNIAREMLKNMARPGHEATLRVHAQ